MREKPNISLHHPLCFEGLEIFSFPASKFICQPRFAGFGAIWLGLPYKIPHFIGENSGIPTKITPNWIPTTKSRTKHFRHVMWTSPPEESLPCSQPWKCIDESFAVLAFTMWIFLVSASDQTKKTSKKNRSLMNFASKKMANHGRQKSAHEESEMLWKSWYQVLPTQPRSYISSIRKQKASIISIKFSGYIWKQVFCKWHV